MLTELQGEAGGGGDRRAAGRARVVLGVFGMAVALCLAVALTNDPTPPFVPPPGATSDLDVFRRIVTRVHDGGSFYDVTQQELRSHGYPTRSAFNWRTPVYAWWLGSGVGWAWGRWVLIVGVTATLVMACRDLLDEEGLIPASMAALFVVGATAWGFGGETYLFMELWAGMLIAFSVCARRRGLTALAVASGLSALFYRELALPYCVVALGLAAWHGRKREAAAWAVGLALFAAFMAAHAYQVHARLTPVDQAMEGGWVRFGGLRFILLTAQTNVFLMPLPLWCTALYLPLAVLGLAGARDETGAMVGLTAGLYLAAFAVVGNPFNFYWGFIDAPLLAMGLARTPRVLAALIETAFAPGTRLRPALARD